MKKVSFFVKNYSACWKFLNESKWHVVFAFGILMLLFFIGFIYPFFFRQEIFEWIEKLVLSLEGKGTLEIIAFIFFNNLKASFFAIITGIGFGILPLITIVLNGYLLGFVIRESAVRNGIGVLWQLVPHGIFELPAILFSVGIGMKIGTDLFGKDIGKKLKYNFREGLRFFVFVIFPLLLVAGIIEGILIGLT
ncbi:MAG: stage II sporulation protein M [Nanoarchaeota archaeon]|nr:stage II sporulation protein M [Nanoarchaeota archaeon]